MSYNPKKSSNITPFAQISHTTSYNLSTRPTNISVAWASGSTTGSNGYSFIGKGYVWGHTNNNSSIIGSIKIGETGDTQYLWGTQFVQSYTSRAACDDEFISYGNSTEVTAGTIYNGASLDFGDKTRINIIRIEAT